MELDANGEGVLRLRGAEIAIKREDRRQLFYRVITPMPEQPFGLDLRTYTTTRYVPIYIPR